MHLLVYVDFWCKTLIKHSLTKSECTWQDVNHAVVAVGYGVENGVPYWLIKNSWGADWGDHGYFKMELGKNMCGKYLKDLSHGKIAFNFW